MRYKVKLHSFAGTRRKVKYIEAGGFYVSDGALVFHRQGKYNCAIAAGAWYQVSEAST